MSTFSPAFFLFISCCQSASFVLALVFGLRSGLTEEGAQHIVMYTAKPIRIIADEAMIVPIAPICRLSFCLTEEGAMIFASYSVSFHG